jgi:type II secretory ATPase GspE/PulE/Tfp pilus assembly ATPase PilB-like protein
LLAHAIMGDVGDTTDDAAVRIVAELMKRAERAGASDVHCSSNQTEPK